MSCIEQKVESIVEWIGTTKNIDEMPKQFYICG